MGPNTGNQTAEDYRAVVAHIERIVGDIAESKQMPRPKVAESTRLLGGGLPVDSLDLASILLQLETITGRDPFREGFINFRTVGELARLYTR